MTTTTLVMTSHHLYQAEIKIYTKIFKYLMLHHFEAEKLKRQRVLATNAEEIEECRKKRDKNYTINFMIIGRKQSHLQFL